jgi:membrane protease YdiL (CAAX protease family)
LLKRVLPFYGVVTLFAVGYALFSGGAATLLGERACEPKELAAALGIALLLAGLARVGMKGWKPLKRAAEAGGALLGPLSVGHAVSLGVLAGVSEELLFRGALWPGLHLAGASALGGLVHFVPRRGLWIYPLHAAVVGLVMGLLREGSRSVLPSMLAHTVLDVATLLWITARPASAAGGTPPAPPGAPPAPPAPPSPAA